MRGPRMLAGVRVAEREGAGKTALMLIKFTSCRPWGEWVWHGSNAGCGGPSGGIDEVHAAGQ